MYDIYTNVKINEYQLCANNITDTVERRTQLFFFPSERLTVIHHFCILLCWPVYIGLSTIKPSVTIAFNVRSKIKITTNLS